MNLYLIYYVETIVLPFLLLSFLTSSSLNPFFPYFIFPYSFLYHSYLSPFFPDSFLLKSFLSLLLPFPTRSYPYSFLSLLLSFLTLSFPYFFLSILFPFIPHFSFNPSFPDSFLLQTLLSLLLFFPSSPIPRPSPSPYLPHPFHP